MESESSRRRSVRQAITRKRSRYLDPETDDDFDISDAQESGDEQQLPSKPVAKKPKHTAKRPGRKPQRKTRSTARKAVSKQSPPNRKAKDASKLTKEIAPALPIISSDGVKPKWQTLPYEILSQIFSYAFASELELETGAAANRRVNHPNTWIMRTARRVCKAFTEPALTAFYKSPNLLAPRWIEDFATLITQPKERQLFSYHMKVTSLELSARNLDSFVKDQPHVLYECLSGLPRLSSLLITHQLDDPPYEYQGRMPRWKYTPQLFEVLDQHNIRLEKWRWNALLIENQHDSKGLQGITEFLDNVHQRSSMQSVRHLTISHLPAMVPSTTIDALDSPEEAAAEVAFSKIFNGLPNLRTLSFESCDRLSTEMLRQLPETLEAIHFVNCMPLTSDILGEFLTSHGHSIRELVLDHNPFLDLAFFTSLRSTCPKLQSLKMDLYDHRENYFRHFGEPKYESLLLEDEVPTWPPTLQTLELVHMQKWGANAAQNLFKSLVESADSLPSLRRLVLQAHINISWRDRAAFRDQWIERLRRVYKRYATAPDPKLASFREFRQWKELQAAKAARENVLSRVEIVVRKPTLSSQQSQASDDMPLAKRRSRREVKPAEPLRQPTPPPEIQTRSGRRKQGRRTSDAISVMSGSNDKDGEDWRDTPERFIQGLCDVVDIRIDNQRPREEQFNESHFLDSEASGDEEWTEGAEIEADDYAW